MAFLSTFLSSLFYKKGHVCKLIELCLTAIIPLLMGSGCAPCVPVNGFFLKVMVPVWLIFVGLQSPFQKVFFLLLIVILFMRHSDKSVGAIACMCSLFLSIALVGCDWLGSG